MYAIPLDSARSDAAPHNHAGAGGAGRSGGSTGGGGSARAGGASNGSSGGSAGSTSSVGAAGSPSSSSSAGSGSTAGGAGSSGSAGSHGSSSSGPTANGTPGGSDQAGAAANPVLIPGGEPGSLIHSSDGFGSSPVVPGLSTSGSDAAQYGSPGDAAAPVLALALAGLVLAVGAFAGVRSVRGPRRQPPLG
jgi:hypothetical protein